MPTFATPPADEAVLPITAPLDPALQPTASPAALERSTGRVEIAFKRRGAVTTLAHLHQAGCGKARLPRPAITAQAEAVLINLAGGLTGGDRLAFQIGWQEGAEATVSGQAAEKIYRAQGASNAVIETRLDVALEATALWLPQETILFERARLVRRNRFRVARYGRLLALEATILGRTAMGETVTTGLFDESVEVRYANRLLLAERQRFKGRIAGLLAHPAVGHGATALVSLLYVGEAAASRLGAVRDALGETPAAASAPDPNLVIVRWLAPSPTGLRNHLVTALFALTSALGLPRQLPRVWSC
jgi:urease accessory protein